MPDEAGERRNQQGRVIERGRAHDFETDPGAEGTKADVDVVEDLDMIAEEADRLDDDGGVPLLAYRDKRLLDGGPEPFNSVGSA